MEIRGEYAICIIGLGMMDTPELAGPRSGEVNEKPQTESSKRPKGF